MLVRKSSVTATAVGWAASVPSRDAHQPHAIRTPAAAFSTYLLRPSTGVWTSATSLKPRTSASGVLRAQRSDLQISSATVAAGTYAAPLPLPSRLPEQRRYSSSTSILGGSSTTEPNADGVPQENATGEELQDKEQAASPAHEVPAAVLQRISASKHDLLRLFHYATDEKTAAVPTGRLEAAFRKQLELQELARQQMSLDSRVQPAVPETWVAAVWDVLAPHCYFHRMSAAAASGSSPSAASKDDAHAVHVCPFNWAAAVEQLASSLPYEGWSEQQVYAHLRQRHKVMEAHSPLWLPRYTQADSLARFICNRYSNLILLTRSAVTGEPVFHRVGRNSVSVTWAPGGVLRTSTSSLSSAQRSSLACANIQHALHTLGRGHQLPVWTDAAELASLLSTRSGLASADPTAWREAWRQDAELRGAFHLDGYVRLRAAPVLLRRLILVDTTTLVPAASSLSPLHIFGEELRCRRTAAAGGATSVKLLRRTASPDTVLQSYRRLLEGALGAATVMEDVVVDALLEPHHVLGALLDAEAAAVSSGNTRQIGAQNMNIGGGGDGGSCVVEGDAEGGPVPETQVLILCGDASRAAFEETLAGVQRDGMAVTLLTPTSV
ncbi:hypothetical protein ABL78_1336 [Leptomonas seymouri]|uniref:Uncharacterized protein n=1 Tax=Leptomonas seymouri TaxID=5684 RepID=A0A0N1IM65_LEPSE|nr:hypothetical protein ABL78_1336 [Leptomonas seymouri]|eukprot:KPI89568.1 hypothetical protein ABL78_1336 [Leptomonas seymouri]